MTSPVVLETFAGASGSGEGYRRAGYDVYAIELHAKPLQVNPFPYLQADAMQAMADLLDGKALTFSDGRELRLEDIDLIHGSPPCQRFSRISIVHGVSEQHPDLIAETRALFKATGKPYVIENVVGAPLEDAGLLCGSALGLGAHCHDGVFRQLRRHRLFEASFFWLAPSCQHKGEPIGVYGHGGGQFKTVWNGGANRGYMGSFTERKEAMGISWMRRAELTQAIPPCMTEYIGGWALKGRLL